MDVVDSGTLVVINGPRFSTRAESRWHQSQGWTVVGMTAAPEAALARELAMCLTSVALVTDLAEHPFRAEEALELVGMGHRLDHFPSQLSGGEQQRVAIARAIAKRPDVLLCDEPTGALDATTGTVVLSAIARVNRELGTTTALITHNAAIAGMADRVLQLADGRIVSDRRNEQRVAPEEVRW